MASSRPLRVSTQRSVVVHGCGEPFRERGSAAMRSPTTIFATALHERGHLRNDVTIDDARDTLWTYNSAELYQLLVIERSWTADHYGQWVAAALTAALL